MNNTYFSLRRIPVSISIILLLLLNESFNKISLQNHSKFEELFIRIKLYTSLDRQVRQTINLSLWSVWNETISLNDKMATYKINASRISINLFLVLNKTMLFNP